MILVALGTQDKSFVRLIEMVEEAIKINDIQEEVIVQAGFTKYNSQKMKIFDYIVMDKFDELLQNCDVIITHGGVGTIISALKLNKKVIAIPRLSQYHEHHNDHQVEVIDSFVEKGYILTCNNSDELASKLENIQSFNPVAFTSNQDNFIDLIRKELEL